MRRIELFDTTLRDGSQAEDVSFTVYDKISLVKALDDFGMEYIELGWPSSNLKDKEAFEKAKELKLKTSKIVAFGSTHRKGIKPEEDANLKGLVESGADIACIFGKTIKQHIKLQLRCTPEENLELIRGSVKHLKDSGMRVFYDAEHFFDGYKDDKVYAMECLKVAEEAGAQRLVLCDTNGGTLPTELLNILREVHKMFDNLGVHLHNDNGCAVANSILATPYVRQIHGTINGFGERTGNADLCQVIPNLMLKEGITLNVKLKGLKKLSEMVYTLSNNKPDKRQPYVGNSSFSHKGGVHVDAINKGASYEHIDPEEVGNRRRIVLSELSGKANLIEAAARQGLKLDKNHLKMAEAMKEVESMEKKGYSIGTLEAEQFLLVKKFFNDNKETLDVMQWKILSEFRNGEFSESVIVGQVNGKRYEVVAPMENVGPVGATYSAMQKLLVADYPNIMKVKLVNYKVRIAEDKGADSSVRVYVEFRDNGNLWGTAGVSTNILEASLEAIRKGFLYYLLRG